MDSQGVARPEELTVAPLVPTPDEIRERLGSFPRLGRGYDPQPVDVYLRMVADCLERVADQNQSLVGRVNELARKVAFHEGRAWAVQEALVTAQTLQAEAREAAEAEARRIRAEAASDAEEVLAATHEERDRLLGEVEEASAQAVRIRDHAQAESEVLRQEALKELDGLRDTVATEIQELHAQATQEAEQIREEARRAAKEVEDEALGQLERRSAMLMGQIEERHRALERLEEKRLEVLGRLQHILVRELEAVQSEQARPPVGDSGDGRSSLLVTGSTAGQAREVPASSLVDGGATGDSVATGIIMPDNTVVIVPAKAKRKAARRPLTDAPGPLDPGVRDAAEDEDVPIAAQDVDLVVPLDTVGGEDDEASEELPQQ
jgi:cell division septum initiation protein DivIVA